MEKIKLRLVEEGKNGNVTIGGQKPADLKETADYIKHKSELINRLVMCISYYMYTVYFEKDERDFRISIITKVISEIAEKDGITLYDTDLVEFWKRLNRVTLVEEGFDIIINRKFQDDLALIEAFLKAFDLYNPDEVIDTAKDDTVIGDSAKSSPVKEEKHNSDNQNSMSPDSSKGDRIANEFISLFNNSIANSLGNGDLVSVIDLKWFMDIGLLRDMNWKTFVRGILPSLDRGSVFCISSTGKWTLTVLENLIKALYNFRTTKAIRRMFTVFEDNFTSDDFTSKEFMPIEFTKIMYSAIGSDMTQDDMVNDICYAWMCCGTYNSDKKLELPLYTYYKLTNIVRETLRNMGEEYAFYKLNFMPEELLTEKYIWQSKKDNISITDIKFVLNPSGFFKESTVHDMTGTYYSADELIFLKYFIIPLYRWYNSISKYHNDYGSFYNIFGYACCEMNDPFCRNVSEIIEEIDKESNHSE